MVVVSCVNWVVVSCWWHWQAWDKIVAVPTIVESREEEEVATVRPHVPPGATIKKKLAGCDPLALLSIPIAGHCGVGRRGGGGKILCMPWCSEED